MNSQRSLNSNTQKLKKVHEIYSEVQVLSVPESKADKNGLSQLSNSWKDPNTPTLQRRVVDQELENLREGVVSPVFAPVIDVLNSLDLQCFSLLDAACASGYYSEVIRSQITKDVQYRGCDYSEAMIEEARRHYPDLHFDVQDLTNLTYPSKGFDVVLLSGVLEHIPNFSIAISEACRVCTSYLILHRCPLTVRKQHEYTRGSQYNIETPRIYFAQHLVLKEFKKHGFSLIREMQIYGKPNTLVSQLKSTLRTIIRGSRVKAPTRRIVTFLFQRE